MHNELRYWLSRMYDLIADKTQTSVQLKAMPAGDRAVVHGAYCLLLAFSERDNNIGLTLLQLWLDTMDSTAHSLTSSKNDMCHWVSASAGPISP
jgi:hypothetical protein